MIRRAGWWAEQDFDAAFVDQGDGFACVERRGGRGEGVVIYGNVGAGGVEEGSWVARWGGSVHAHALGDEEDGG